jgi:carbonic anhydrase
MSVTDRLLANADAYAAAFPTHGAATSPSALVAIVVCMDSRVDVHGIFGLSPGDAHVIRNAGGIVTDDTVRSLAISQRRLRTTEIILVHHTDCGMLTFTDDDFAREVETETGSRPSWSAGTFPDLEDDVRESIARIRSSPFVPHRDSIRGFVFDVHTGKLSEVLPVR